LTAHGALAGEQQLLTASGFQSSISLRACLTPDFDRTAQNLPHSVDALGHGSEAITLNLNLGL
jgi:hypothetical protein